MKKSSLWSGKKYLWWPRAWNSVRSTRQWRIMALPSFLRRAVWRILSFSPIHSNSFVYASLPSSIFSELRQSGHTHLPRGALRICRHLRWYQIFPAHRLLELKSTMLSPVSCPQQQSASPRSPTIASSKFGGWKLNVTTWSTTGSAKLCVASWSSGRWSATSSQLSTPMNASAAPSTYPSVSMPTSSTAWFIHFFTSLQTLRWRIFFFAW